MTSRHSLLGKMPTETFLRKYWQQQALLFRAALDAKQATALVDRQQLFTVAADPDAESRLVMTDSKYRDWRSEHGPFSKTALKRLPESHWTLLVQAVDQWLPQVAKLLPQFSFLPRWRLDDIMVSYATDGGGVGPHFDYYDVFLLQASGKRRWQLGQYCDERTVLRDNPDMKLLEQFRQQDEMVLEAGDMLYIPAGLAHWGTAVGNDCITISIGFRAASQRELVQIAANAIAVALPDHRRYRDTRESIDPDMYRINASAAKNASEFWKQQDQQAIDNALARALGEYATQPRNPDRIMASRPVTVASLKRQLSRSKEIQLQKHPASRFAWRAIAGKPGTANFGAELYVDGETHPCSVVFAKSLCSGFVKPAVAKLHQELLLQLLEQGSVALGPVRKR